MSIVARIFALIGVCSAVWPLVLAAVSPVVFLGYEYMACHTFECCNDRWIKRNETELRERLRENIYGQPFATRILLNAVGNRWSDPEQQYDKPLVMMLHGPTGVGKNYITRTLANSMYTQGTNSVFIHYMTSAVHFTSDDSIKHHISQLQSWIEGNSTNCGENLFVFDEARRFPSGLFDGLLHFMAHGSPAAKRLGRSIFVFLYEGDEPVVDWAQDLYENGEDRETISLLRAEEVLLPYIMSEAGSMHDSVLVKRGLIDYHIPLLPLERKHVRKCIADSIHMNILSKGANPVMLGYEDLDAMVDVIEKQIYFFPEDTPIFSAYGCKKIEGQVLSEFRLPDFKHEL